MFLVTEDEAAAVSTRHEVIHVHFFFLLCYVYTIKIKVFWQLAGAMSSTHLR